MTGKNRKYKIVTCPDCDEQRSVRSDSPHSRCLSCAAKYRGFGKLRGGDNPSWKGGRRKTVQGYILITLDKDSPYIGMARKNKGGNGNSYCILEHRLVMAEHLGRLLKQNEIVHHINSIKDDNRKENLELLSAKKDHLPYMILEQRVSTLEKRMVILEAENELLRISINKGVDKWKE